MGRSFLFLRQHRTEEAAVTPSFPCGMVLCFRLDLPFGQYAEVIGDHRVEGSIENDPAAAGRGHLPAENEVDPHGFDLAFPPAVNVAAYGNAFVLGFRQHIGVLPAAGGGVQRKAHVLTGNHPRPAYRFFQQHQRVLVAGNVRGKAAFIPHGGGQAFFQQKGLLYADDRKAIEVMDENLDKNVWLKGRRDMYSKMMFEAVRDARQQEMDVLINKIYEINKPVVRKILLRKMM